MLIQNKVHKRRPRLHSNNEERKDQQNESQNNDSISDINVDNQNLYHAPLEQLYSKKITLAPREVPELLENKPDKLVTTADSEILHSDDCVGERQMSTIFEDLNEEDAQLSNMIRHASLALNAQDDQDPFFLFKDNYYDANIKIILYLQSLVRKKRVLKKYKIIRKWASYRVHVLVELRDSEKSYVQDLGIIINTILAKVRQQNILTEQEITKAFMNVEQIYNLNNSFLTELTGTQQLSTFITKLRLTSITITNCLESFLTPLSHSSEFIMNIAKISLWNQYHSQDRLMYKLKRQMIIKKCFDQFVENLDISGDNILRGLSLESFVVKPVQRLPKYILLLKDLLKHTEETHPDYQPLKTALESFTDVTRKLNQKIEMALKTHKIFDLQRIFGDPNNLNILESTRTFVAEEIVNVLYQNTEKSVIVYFLTDMLVFSERDKIEKLFQIVYLDEKSFCKNIPDQKYLSHLFTLTGKARSITFICDSQESKLKMIELIDCLIQNLQEIQVNKEMALEKQNQSFRSQQEIHYLLFLFKKTKEVSYNLGYCLRN